MSLSQNKRRFRILGFATLIVVALVLLAAPTSLFSPTVTFIDTDPFRSTEYKTPVRTKSDFGIQDVISIFPQQIDIWLGSEYDATQYVAELGANLILMRRYDPSTPTQPVFFTIVQAKTESAFHPPEICFPSQGYQIQEEENDQVTMIDPIWIKGASSITIPVKKIVITKSSTDGKIMERRVTLFCYVKGNQFYSDTITMIQTQALAPIEGSYEDSLSEQKDFLAQAVPLMFAPSQVENNWRPPVVMLIDWGPVGFMLLALLLLAPITMILYPGIRRKPVGR